MIQEIIDKIPSFSGKFINELLEGNWLIGQGIINQKYIEIRYSTNQDLFFQNLIDDIWFETKIWDKVTGSKNERVILYICHPQIVIETSKVLIENELNLSSKFERTIKYYVKLTDEIRNKINVDLSNTITHTINKRSLSTPLISIITTVFNNSKVLEQTIQSVINQSSDNFEYIIKDAESTDGFEQVIAKYKPYISKIIRSKDNGIYDGMHQGFLQSKGKYFAYLNSDDIYIDNNVISLYENSISEFEADAYFSNIKILNQKTRETKIREGNISRLKVESSINHPTLFLKSENYLKVGGFDLTLKIAADGDLTIKLVKAGTKFHHLQETVILFRDGGTSYNIRQKFMEDLICRYRYSKFNIIGYLYVLGREIKRKLLK